MTQEMASIARAITALLTGYKVFYNHVPEGYSAPAVYFPSPSIEVMSDCLDGFRYEYSWYIKIFHRTTHDAWSGATLIQSEFKNSKNLIPLVDTNGDSIGKYMRVKDIRLTEVEERTMQVYVRWHSHRGYGTDELVTEFDTTFLKKGEL